jgi:hypothetical protein
MGKIEQQDYNKVGKRTVGAMSRVYIRKARGGQSAKIVLFIANPLIADY